MVGESLPVDRGAAMREDRTAGEHGIHPPLAVEVARYTAAGQLLRVFSVLQMRLDVTFYKAHSSSEYHKTKNMGHNNDRNFRYLMLLL